LSFDLSSMNILKNRKSAIFTPINYDQKFMNLAPVKLGVFRYNMQVRFYARESTRRTTTEEQQTQDSKTGLWQSRDSTLSRGQDEQEYDPNETTESSITPDVRVHLSKVYGTMMSAFGLASVGVVSASFLPPLFSMACMIGSIGGVLGVYFSNKENVSFRQNLFLGTGFLFGAGIAPLVLTATPGVVFMAALGTAALFGGFSLAALKAKRRSMLYLGGALTGGVLILLAAVIAGAVLPLMGVTNPAFLGALYNINIYGGLGLFSLFVAYDTQRMIEAFKAGDTDHVSPALSMFINLMGIFVRLIQIFRGD